MIRNIVLVAAIGLVYGSVWAEELILVNKKSGAEISPLKAGVEFELEGEVYVVQEGKVSNPKFSTPREVLEAYFACEEWVERIPLVVESERVGKLMAKYYSSGYSRPKFVEIDAKPQSKTEESELHIFNVNVSGNDVVYAVRATDDGYRVDWEESQRLLKVAEARKHKVENAEFVVMVTTKRGNYSDWTDIRLDVWNNSKAFISLWNVDILFYDKDKEYLGQESIQGYNLKPGMKMFETDSVRDIKAADIDSWSLELHSISLENADPDAENLYQAEKYFKLREVKKKK